MDGKGQSMTGMNFQEERPSLFRRLHRLSGVDWPVLISVGGRLSNTLFVPITLTYITHELTPQQQGVYYTFASIFALQSFLELGFLSCISHVASHHNRTDVADRTIDHRDVKLLISYSMAYAGALALAVFILIGGIGWFVISGGADPVPFARGPWWLFVTVSCLNICLSPAMAILDGCNKVLFTSVVRVLGLLATNMALCAALASGAGLYAAALGTAALVVVTIVGLLSRFRHLFGGLWQNVGDGYRKWHKIIFPFQGKIAVTTICSYVLGALFTPLLFRVSGAEAAGRFAMSLQLMNSIGAISLAWTTTKTGIYGRLAQAQDRRPLMRLFYRTTLQSAAFATAGSAALLLLYLCARDALHVFSRMLPLWEMVLLAWPVLTIQFTVAASSLFRSFGEERLLKASIAHTLIHVTLLLLLVPLLGALGAVWAQVLSYTFGLVFCVHIFRKFVREKNLSYA